MAKPLLVGALASRRGIQLREDELVERFQNCFGRLLAFECESGIPCTRHGVEEQRRRHFYVVRTKDSLSDAVPNDSLTGVPDHPEIVLKLGSDCLVVRRLGPEFVDSHVVVPAVHRFEEGPDGEPPEVRVESFCRRLVGRILDAVDESVRKVFQ